MNGFIILSLENGMMLSSESFVGNFGLVVPIDPIQQCGLLYTLYMSSRQLCDFVTHSADNNFSFQNENIISAVQSPLSWFVQVTTIFT